MRKGVLALHSHQLPPCGEHGSADTTTSRAALARDACRSISALSRVPMPLFSSVDVVASSCMRWHLAGGRGRNGGWGRGRGWSRGQNGVGSRGRGRDWDGIGAGIGAGAEREGGVARAGTRGATRRHRRGARPDAREASRSRSSRHSARAHGRTSAQAHRCCHCSCRRCWQLAAHHCLRHWCTHTRLRAARAAPRLRPVAAGAARHGGCLGGGPSRWQRRPRRGRYAAPPQRTPHPRHS